MSLTLIEHHRVELRSNRTRLSRSTVLAALCFAALFGIALLLVPFARPVLVRVALPDQPTTIVVEPPPVELPPEPEAQHMLKAEQLDVFQDAEPPAVESPLPEAPVARGPEPELEAEAARIGRERARQATQSLAAAASALDRSLSGLSSSLEATTGEDPLPRGNPRRVGAGRADNQLAQATVLASSGAAVDLGSKVKGSQIAIGSLATKDDAGATAAETPSGAGAPPGIYRSNASLLATIRRYAAGIQYCYDSELKRDPRLQGKLAVAMTVTASGQVENATIVQNTLGSDRLADCALSQIRDWRFPAIPEGLTTFQAPFVFTPPQ